MKPNIVVDESVDISIVDALKIIMSTVTALASFILFFAYLMHQFFI